MMALVGYDTCDAVLAGLRTHTAAHVTAWGLENNSYAYGEAVRGPVPAAESAAGTASDKNASAPDHSTTNDQEADADEPDLVKTDGRRIVTVSGGVLRVVDAASRTLTGSLDLRAYAGADGAQLLLAGDRALVVLGEQYQLYRGPMAAYGSGPVSSQGSTFLLIDLSDTPTLISTLHTDGGYVDARLVAGVARVVVASEPHIAFPAFDGTGSQHAAVARNREVVRRAPLSAWLPTYQTTADGRTTTHRVPCDRISHPTSYSGESVVTVYSFDPATSLDDPSPISIAADASTVYATGSDLYVASTDGNRTQVHRFGLVDRTAPRYLGSSSVPGWLLNSYSLSEYDGYLRVVTSSGRTSSTTSLYVLDADTLRRRGSVGGLGAGENLHAVRFLGALAYVVTFESVDPLFVLDLSDPDHPRRAGELTVSGYSDYLHPTDDGRLLGVGEDVGADQRVRGLQVSLFDVADTSSPKRLANVVRRHTPSETPIDPHAFLYWPRTRTAVVPIDSWESGQSGAALVLRVGRTGLTVVGTLRNPAITTSDSYDTGIERTLVIGDEVWTMSGSGLLASNLKTLDRVGWVAFS